MREAPDDPAAEMALAHDALADADAARGNLTDRAIVNRLYYACYHAAQAVLCDRGIEADTHGGTVRLFGREVTQKGAASGADGSFLNKMLERRSHADYKLEPLSVDVDALYTRTETFVENMAELLGADEE